MDLIKWQLNLVSYKFWSEIILAISNRTRATRSFDFEITRMISDQIALHSVQLPLLIIYIFVIKGLVIWSRVPETTLPRRQPYRAFICENVDPVGRVKADFA